MDNPDERARFHMLIDTCVWLDIAKDYQQQAILAALISFMPLAIRSVACPIRLMRPDR